MADTYEPIYPPDFMSPTRIPILVIIREDVSEADADDLGMKEWKAESDRRPVIMLRASEARRLAAETFAALARLENLAASTHENSGRKRQRSDRRAGGNDTRRRPRVGHDAGRPELRDYRNPDYRCSDGQTRCARSRDASSDARKRVVLPADAEPGIKTYENNYIYVGGLTVFRLPFWPNG